MADRSTPDDDDLPSLPDNITRKDFLNTALLGAGAALLGAPSPAAALARRIASPLESGAAADPWTGPGGVGDYAASNGNTKAVMDAAHRIRDGVYAKAPKATSTGETYDLVIVGGGITGLTAAYTYAKATDNQKTCLVLENHPMFGGEAKQNEIVVNGVRLIAPQGSNDFGVPRAGAGNNAWLSEVWDDLRMPREFTWTTSDDSATELRMSQDNYQPMEGIGEYGIDIGYYFDQLSTIGATAKPTWLRNIWQNDLAELAVSDDVKRDLIRWRTTNPDTKDRSADQFARYLDTMSYRDYLEKALGYRPEVTKMIEPVIGLISGASPDAVSAHAAQQIGMPGVARARGKNTGPGLSFPGGNVTYARHLVKRIIPAAIPGDATFEGILMSSVDWAALDRAKQPTRIRLGSTVARVEHVGSPDIADTVRVTYAKGGHLYEIRARRVAMASGGWVNRRVVVGLPPEILSAYASFQYAPALIVNVALTNWRFMHKLGITAARWFDHNGIGFVANIRRQMAVGKYRAPVKPEEPTVLTFYSGLYTPGKTAAEQGSLGRAALLEKSYADFERLVVRQMTRQFAASGFGAGRDIAGIILNRWGHARLVQPPGWFYGVDGNPAPREVVARGFGRIAIGHSELNGHQSATGAMSEGRRLGQWAAS